ncbi:hypothetical protein GP486_005626 [Trichoglossum hirsutum]|uniref:Uncharacterized protein n=1 Tax=Trichoglossum hirsutum TaxID=265104 RepID=A0A9P8RLW8_9PEZI|nr:hypothetical protein GP486_005626 [Trichoglossum hirsutum]
MRLEIFRCSHPVTSLAGREHLVPTSNRIFRMIFSYGQLDEIRETFDEDGSFSLYIRDIDSRSDSFSRATAVHGTPKSRGLALQFKILAPPSNVHGKVLTSPYNAPVAQLVSGFPDLADIEQQQHTGYELSIVLTIDDGGNSDSDALAKLSQFSSTLQHEYPTLSQNVSVYQRMGDFRDKHSHSGINLTGNNPRLVS